MRSYRYILSISLLVLSLAYTLWFVFAGFGNHQDPLYWLYKYEHLEGGWLAIGTLLTGGAFVRIFGAQLLPLRLLGWLCTTMAIALPYCCLLPKEQQRDNLYWLALAYLFMGYGAFQEFSPGTLSVLLLSALWVTAVKFDIRNHKFEFIPAILLGLAVAARFPNILALLVLIPLWKKRCLWNIPIAALTAGIVYLLGYFLVTSAVADAAISSHNLWPMVTKLWTNGGKLVGFLFLAVGVLAIGKYSFYNYKYTIALGVAVGIALVFFVAYAIKPHQWYNTDLTYLLSALCLVIALNSRSSISNLKYIIVGVALMVVATFGTDTAWLKLFPAVLCLLPVTVVQYEEKERNYLCCVLAVFSVIVMARMTTNSVAQSNLTKVQTFASVAPYTGIAIRETGQQRLTQYKTDYDSLITNSQSQILAVGQDMHLMRAVTGCEAARYNEFWSNIFDSVYTAKYREIIQAEKPIVFCSFSPQFKTKPEYKDKESRIEQMLLDEGYMVLDRSQYKYMIYLPSNDQ